MLLQLVVVYQLHLTMTELPLALHLTHCELNRVYNSLLNSAISDREEKLSRFVQLSFNHEEKDSSLTGICEVNPKVGENSNKFLLFLLPAYIYWDHQVSCIRDSLSPPWLVADVVFA